MAHLRISRRLLPVRTQRHLITIAHQHGATVEEGDDIIISGISQKEADAARAWVKNEERSGLSEHKLAEINRLFNTPISQWNNDDFEPEDLAPHLFK